LADKEFRGLLYPVVLWPLFRFVSGAKIIHARKSCRLAVWNGIDKNYGLELLYFLFFVGQKELLSFKSEGLISL